MKGTGRPGKEKNVPTDILIVLIWSLLPFCSLFYVYTYNEHLIYNTAYYPNHSIDLI